MPPCQRLTAADACYAEPAAAWLLPGLVLTVLSAPVRA